MKIITPSLSGLASSLLLNVGLTQAAEKLDPLLTQHHGQITDSLSAMICVACEPCSFTASARR